jgi:hypothetical protein
MEQMQAFAGNMLFVKNSAGKSFVILSATAWGSLNAIQKQQLQSIAEPLFADISTIENAGGGSARCMVAEIF